jgi:hypothetical protein
MTGYRIRYMSRWYWYGQASVGKQTCVLAMHKYDLDPPVSNQPSKLLMKHAFPCLIPDIELKH